MASPADEDVETEEIEEESSLEDLSDDELTDEVDLEDGDLEGEALDGDDDDDAVSDLGEDNAEEGDGMVVLVADPAAVEAEGAVAEDDDDDEPDDDDVEASLDVILKERLVVADEVEDEEDEETEATDVEDRADGNARVLPKQPGEFVCQSCFLVKSETQLANRKRRLCRDCV